MKYTIKTLNDNGTGIEYNNMAEFVVKLYQMADECQYNGGTYFSVEVDCDASCFEEE